MEETSNFEDYFVIMDENSNSIEEDQSDFVLEIQSDLDKLNDELRSQCRKNEWLKTFRKDMTKLLNKKKREVQKMRLQLKDEKSFHSAEIERFKKETSLPEEIKSTESQTDVSNQPDHATRDDYNRLRYYIKDQGKRKLKLDLKNVKLQDTVDKLEEKLSQLIEKYKKEMSENLLKIDQCRYEFNQMLEMSKLSADDEKLLKVINRSVRLSSDNQILKQEVLHMTVQLKLMNSRRKMKKPLVTSIRASVSEIPEEDSKPESVEVGTKQHRHKNKQRTRRRTRENMKKKDVAVLDESDDSDVSKPISTESSLTVFELFPPREPIIECSEWSGSVIEN